MQDTFRNATYGAFFGNYSGIRIDGRNGYSVLLALIPVKK